LSPASRKKFSGNVSLPIRFFDDLSTTGPAALDIFARLRRPPEINISTGKLAGRI
jgi:hypothetical protein